MVPAGQLEQRIIVILRGVQAELGVARTPALLRKTDMPSKFKNLIHACMAKTGKSWQTAERAVRENAAPVAGTPIETSVETAPPTVGDPACLEEEHCPLVLGR